MNYMEPDQKNLIFMKKIMQIESLISFPNNEKNAVVLKYALLAKPWLLSFCSISSGVNETL